MLSMTTDYVASTGCPEPYLKRIADAGFTHIHWCHQWNTDFIYADCEVEQIAKWLDEYGLKLLDLHSSRAGEKSWDSAVEYQRLAGVELVKNRIDMTARLGGDVVIMHILQEPEDARENTSFWDRMFRSLDELQPYSKERGVRIALENGPFDTVEKALSKYGPEYLGLCYDAGHGNRRERWPETWSGNGLDRLEALKDRLISVHLHDNDGASDQHKLLFSGTIDWERLAGIIAASSYSKCISLETLMREMDIDDEGKFLKQAYETGARFAEMIENAGS